MIWGGEQNADVDSGRRVSAPSYILWSNLGLGVRAWRVFMVQRTADVALEDCVRPPNLMWFWPKRNSPGAELPAKCLSAWRDAIGSFQYRRWEWFSV